MLGEPVEQPVRAERRRVVLDGLYTGIGITDRGMTSAIDYASA